MRGLYGVQRPARPGERELNASANMSSSSGTGGRTFWQTWATLADILLYYFVVICQLVLELHFYR